MLERALQTSHALRVFLPARWSTAQRDAPQVLSALDSRLGLLVLSSSQQIKHWLHGGEKHSAFWIRMSICICSEKCPRLTAAPSLPCVFISVHVNQPSLRILSISQTPRIPEFPPSSLRHLPPPLVSPLVRPPALLSILLASSGSASLVATSATCSPIHLAEMIKTKCSSLKRACEDACHTGKS